jgi:hypothetical protein
MIHTDTDDIELKTPLQKLLLNLLGDAVETNVASGKDSIPLGHCHSHVDGRVRSEKDDGN